MIGGKKYKVIFNSIDIAEHSATVRAELKAEKGVQSVTFLLVQNPENKWHIITDMATQKNNHLYSTAERAVDSRVDGRER